MSGSSRLTGWRRPCTASTASTRSAGPAPPKIWPTPSRSCFRRPPAGSPAPSGTSTAASWPAATNRSWEDPMAHVVWDNVTRDNVVRAIQEYDRLGPEGFFSAHGFGPTTTYDLVWDERRYPPKAILGTAYEFATGERLASHDFEGGKTGAVAVLGRLGFTVEPRRSTA